MSERADNRPAVRWVFIHGAGGNGDLWAKVAPYFPPDSWIVDLPGHEGGRAKRAGQAGATAAPVGPRIAAYAAWVRAGVVARGWNDVVVAGHSMGGAIAQTIGLQRPAWLRGLVLSSTGAVLPVPAVLRTLLATDYPAAVDWLIDRAFARPPSTYGREGVRRQLLRVPAAVTRGDYEACAAFDVRAALGAGGLAGPAVVLCGAADRLTPPERAQWLATALGAPCALLPDTGHMAPVEQPAAWSRTVLDLWTAASRAATGR